MIYVLLFILGLVFGSFLNVVALRYDGEHNLFDPNVIGGRSHCPQCMRKLRWFELVPVLSFVIQKARCRHCSKKIGIQYPLVELLVACLFVTVPLGLQEFFFVPGVPLGPVFWVLAALWITVFTVLVLISYIDVLLGIIPDEGHFILGALAVLIVSISALWSGMQNTSFLGEYAALFGFQQNIWVVHVMGMVFGFIFFEFLALVTRGRGMGMGDVKLALPLGFLFGWPDILFVIVAAFIMGAVVGILGIALKHKKMEGTLPFGPFLALGSAFVFFFGFNFLQWYFRLLGF